MKIAIVYSPDPVYMYPFIDRINQGCGYMSMEPETWGCKNYKLIFYV